MGQTLRDWYRYLEKQMHVSLADDTEPSSARAQVNPTPPTGIPERRFQRGATPAGVTGGAMGPPSAAAVAEDRKSPAARATALRRRIDAVVEQHALPMELGAPERRRGGRRPITETREEIIRRLLDPELTLHEAAAVLNLSKATVRRYTDQRRLACVRTSGGQRRFRLSTLLAFLEQQAQARGEP